MNFDTAVAERHHLNALARRERINGPDSLPVADSLYRVARFYTTMCRFPEAIALQERAFSIQEALHAAPNERVRLGLGRVRTEASAGHLERAVELLTLVTPLVAAEGPRGVHFVPLLGSRIALAVLRHDLAEEISARLALLEAATSQRELRPNAIGALAALKDAYERTGATAKAVQLVSDYSIVERSFGDPVPEYPPDDPLACYPLGGLAPPGFVKDQMVPFIKMKPAIWRCYRGPELQSGKLDGATVMELALNYDGEVVHARVLGAGVPATALECMLGVARTMEFEAPTGGHATVYYDYLFQPL